MSRRRLQNHLWFRSLTALFGVWFVLATTDVGSLHACPMHDGPVSASVMDMGGDGGQADHGMHAEHAAPGNEGPAQNHCCTCISTCCAATTPLASRMQLVELTSTVSFIAPAVFAAALEPRVFWIDFVLPFANAPPMIANV